MARIAIQLFSAAVCALLTGVVVAQDYPTKPIRIVTAAAGGGGDILARLMAQALTTPLNQQVVVDNRGSGVIPPDIVAKSPPDGYTLLLYGNSLWVGPLFQKAPYDPVRDFLPISPVSIQPNTLVAHPSLPVKSVKELISLAKARPGELNYAITALGSANHLAAILFNSQAKVNIVVVPYAANSSLFADIIAGRVQLFFGSAAAVTPYVKSGKLRALAVTSAQRSALAPDLPTVAASGLPGYETVAKFALLAPAKTPTAIIDRLNQEIVRVLQRADVKERFLTTGVEAASSSPDELAASIRSEMATVSKAIKEAGIKVEQ